MSITVLQQRIREKKTPIALGLRPELEKLPEKIRKNFEDMFGTGPMADAESLRYHGTQLLEAAGEKLPAVLIHAGSYLRLGMMGTDVLWNLVSAAKNKGLYVILGVGTGEPDVWWSTGCDAVTVNPYMGGDVCAVPEDKAVFALVRTCNPSAHEAQTLIAGDRPMYAAMAEQMSRRGAGIVVGTGYSLDVQEIRRRNKNAFMLLPECDIDNAYPAFDPFGRGAMMVDFDLQYTGDFDGAIAAVKKEVSVL